MAPCKKGRPPNKGPEGNGKQEKKEPAFCSAPKAQSVANGNKPIRRVKTLGTKELKIRKILRGNKKGAKTAPRDGQRKGKGCQLQQTQNRPKWGAHSKKYYRPPKGTVSVGGVTPFEVRTRKPERRPTSITETTFHGQTRKPQHKEEQSANK